MKLLFCLVSIVNFVVISAVIIAAAVDAILAVVIVGAAAILVDIVNIPIVITIFVFFILHHRPMKQRSCSNNLATVTCVFILRRTTIP